MSEGGQWWDGAEHETAGDAAGARRDGDEQLTRDDADGEIEAVEEIGEVEEIEVVEAVDRDDESSEEEEGEPAEVLEDLLGEIADALDIDVEIEVIATDGVLSGSLRGDDLGLFIGRRGQTIDAVQHLAQRIVFHEGPSDVRVVIDADGYRERRAETLRAEGDAAADEALETGRAVGLDPMPANERRVVHEHLRERGDVRTHSEGEEPERYLVVSPLDG